MLCIARGTSVPVTNANNTMEGSHDFIDKGVVRSQRIWDSVLWEPVDVQRMCSIDCARGVDHDEHADSGSHTDHGENCSGTHLFLKLFWNHLVIDLDHPKSLGGCDTIANGAECSTSRNAVNTGIVMLCDEGGEEGEPCECTNVSNGCSLSWVIHVVVAEKAQVSTYMDLDQLKH